MTITLTSLDIHYLVKELQVLERARLDKVYCGKDHFVFSVYVRGKGKKFLHVKLPSLLYLSDKKQIEAEDTGLCKTLRKHLLNAPLDSIEQYAFERIIILRCREKTVVIELFDKGNILLLSEDNTIITGVRFKKTRERMVRGGVPYIFPKNRVNPLKVTLKEFQEMITEQDQSIVKTLARNLSFGGKYSEYICEKAQVDKKSKQPEPKETKKVHTEMKAVFDCTLKPTQYEMGFLPFAVPHHTPIKIFNSFSELLEKSVYDEQAAQPTIEPASIRKIKIIIKKQKEALQKSIEQQEKHNLVGSKVYEHFADIELLLAKLGELKKKQGWEGVEEFCEGKNIKVNKNKALLTVDLP